MSATLHYADLAAALSRIGYRDPPSGFHGSLCGALCRETPEALDPGSLVASLTGDEDLRPDAQARSELRQVRDAAIDALTDVESGFTPMLPDDDAALAERAHALAAWCEGFLYGLSARKPLELKACSEEVREIVKDFTQFTRAAFGADDDLEVEEGAYAELVEYVRVGAQLIYMELHPRPSVADHDAQTLH